MPERKYKFQAIYGFQKNEMVDQQTLQKCGTYSPQAYYTCSKFKESHYAEIWNTINCNFSELSMLHETSRIQEFLQINEKLWYTTHVIHNIPASACWHLEETGSGKMEEESPENMHSIKIFLIFLTAY